MVTLRCTRRVLQRLKTTPSSAAVTPTTLLGDWYAGWVPERSPLVLAINERTLLSVVVSLAPSITLLERWVGATGDLLLALGIAPTDVEQELFAMQDVTIATTANRRVLGCLNEAIFVRSHLRRREDVRSLLDESFVLAEMMYSTTRYQRPSDLVREEFGGVGPHTSRKVH
jgi:hypothetical protein